MLININFQVNILIIIIHVLKSSGVESAMSHVGHCLENVWQIDYTKYMGAGQE